MSSFTSPSFSYSTATGSAKFWRRNFSITAGVFAIPFPSKTFTSPSTTDKASIAALKALRHPKSFLLRKLEINAHTQLRGKRDSHRCAGAEEISQSALGDFQ